MELWLEVGPGMDSQPPWSFDWTWCPAWTVSPKALAE